MFQIHKNAEHIVGFLVFEGGMNANNLLFIIEIKFWF